MKNDNEIKIRIFTFDIPDGKTLELIFSSFLKETSAIIERHNDRKEWQFKGQSFLHVMS
jgi:hypothetical protein